MKTITSHHDGHGLNESIRVTAVGEPGPGGAHHRYEFAIEAMVEPGAIVKVYCGYLQFQEGPRNAPTSTPGLTTEAVLVALIDHLQEFQEGSNPSSLNRIALEHLKTAQEFIRLRADDRAERGVLGTMAP